eukprot:jgi/Galph1/2616/GphlegSOOS_G1281.1
MGRSAKVSQKAVFLQRQSKQFLKYFGAFCIYVLISELFLINFGFVDVCKELSDSHKSILHHLKKIKYDSERTRPHLTKGDYDSKLAQWQQKLHFAGSKFRQIEWSYGNICRSDRTVKHLATAMKSPFEEIEFATFSPLTIDGVMLYIFSVIGTKSRILVEIEGSAFQQHLLAANFFAYTTWKHIYIIYDSWHMYAEGTTFYQSLNQSLRKKRTQEPVETPSLTLLHKHLDIHNVDSILSQLSAVGEIDILGIFYNEMDFWIWTSISVLKPRVLIVTYKEQWGPYAVAIRSYQATFEPEFTTNNLFVQDREHELFSGASLGAFEEPVAFFIINGEGELIFPQVVPETCFYPKLQNTGWIKDQQAIWEASRSYSWIRNV